MAARLTRTLYLKLSYGPFHTLKWWQPIPLLSLLLLALQQYGFPQEAFKCSKCSTAIMKQGNPSRLVKWYPISFAIAAVVFFIIGGALLGTYFSSGYSVCNDGYYYDGYYNYNSGSCFDGNSGEFYGGIAMLVLGGICKLVAWILFIIWCVKRNRFNQTNIIYNNNVPAPMEQYPQPQQYAAPQPTYPMQHGAQFATRSPASPGPMYPEGAHSAAGTPPPKDPMATATAFKYCPQCGTAANGRFCSQCGAAC